MIKPDYWIVLNFGQVLPRSTTNRSHAKVPVEQDPGRNDTLIAMMTLGAVILPGESAHYSWSVNNAYQGVALETLVVLGGETGFRSQGEETWFELGFKLTIF